MGEWARVRELWARVVALGWPVVTEKVFRKLMRTTDVFITALISPTAVVAIGLGDLYSQFPLRIGQGLGAGVIAISSQDTGGWNLAARDRAIAMALVLGFLAGIPIAAAGVAFAPEFIAVLGAGSEVVRLGGAYLAIILATAPARHVYLVGVKALQGTGDTRTPMVVKIVGNVVNIALSLLLGLGLLGAPNLGVVGVGIGTATGNVLTGALVVLVIVGPWSAAGAKWSWDPSLVRQLLTVGVPRMGEGLVVGLTRFPFNAILLGFGTVVNAGYHIGRRILQQITAPLQSSFGIVASIIVGQAVGTGDAEDARFAGRWVTLFGGVVAGAVGIVVFLAADPIVGLLTDDPATAGYGADFARTFGLTAGIYAVFRGLSGSLQGASETRSPFVGRLVGVVVFMLGFTYVGGQLLGMGPVAAYVGIGLSYTTMAAIVLWHYSRGDWLDRATAMMDRRQARPEPDSGPT